MWYVWISVLLVSSALAEGGTGEVVTTEAKTVVTTEAKAVVTTEAIAVATTARAPPRTLDRQGAELAWRTWLKSPESGNQNAPPRRITTKSLFITPLVCPKGQRLDRNGCVQVVTVNKDEHERILLEQLNARFPSSPSSDVLYDYGDEEQGPLQLSIPIGMDPQAAPLQAQEPSVQAQKLQPDHISMKKDSHGPKADSSIVAELELLKLQHAHDSVNDSDTDATHILNHNVLNNFLPYSEKPKRDSSVVNETDSLNNNDDKGQKEEVYGHVNIDPVVYNTDYQNQQTTVLPSDIVTEIDDVDKPIATHNNVTKINNDANDNSISVPITQNVTTAEASNSSSTLKVLKKDSDKTKLNPENDYSDIGEAIKLISRYAEVTTDDNYSKDQKNLENLDGSILGTRTKLQHRRNKLKQPHIEKVKDVVNAPSEVIYDRIPAYMPLPNRDTYYRYPWQSQNWPTPPPDYPFRHLQDYWQGRSQYGGVYKSIHGNPRRHHHSFPHSFYYRPHGYPPIGYQGPNPGLHENYAGQHQGYMHRLAPLRARSNDQDLYSLLGLRHWFSNEGNTKR